MKYFSLHWAATCGHINVVIVLLTYKARTDLLTKENKTAADLAKNQDIAIALSCMFSFFTLISDEILGKEIDLFCWLYKHQLQSVLKQLEDEDINLKLLMNISEEELKDIGIKLGSRKQLLSAIEKDFKHTKSQGI